MQYCGAIASTTTNPNIKYWEIPAAGCLTFMEITEKNDGMMERFWAVRTVKQRSSTKRITSANSTNIYRILMIPNGKE